MELMVAVGILVVLIIAISKIFKDAGSAVSLSQISLEMFSNVRATQEQLNRDLQGLDKSGFLVIRSQLDPSGSGRRYDQIAFLASGAFANRTGNAGAVTPLADSAASSAGVVWYGHGVCEGTGANNVANEAVAVTPGAIPVGVKGPSVAGGYQTVDQDLVLLRHIMLLTSANRTSATSTTITTSDNNSAIPAYFDAAYTAGNINGAAISASRYAFAQLTPGQIMQNVIANKNGTPRFEADNYCYRFKVLTNPYATEIFAGAGPDLINGMFRMHPILLQGCGSFQVAWTDGSLNGTALKWYGLANGTEAPSGNAAVEPPLSNGDGYTAIFSFDNRLNWPKALKITYRVTDLNTPDRLSGGRMFTQVIALPN